MFTLSILAAMQGTTKEKIQMVVVAVLIDSTYIVPLIF